MFSVSQMGQKYLREASPELSELTPPKDAPAAAAAAALESGRMTSCDGIKIMMSSGQWVTAAAENKMCSK